MGTSYVTYYRVSTSKQGRSGLGLDAQRMAVSTYLQEHPGKELATFTEIESGSNNARPQLAAALLRCRQTYATLLVAKFDRLSRNAGFLLTLRDSKLKFVAADMPDANDLSVGFMAIIAQHEREMISRRTKEALAAAKARGVKLGNPRIKPGDDYAASIARRAAAVEYARRAEELRPVFEAANTVNVKQLCEYFQLQGIPSPRGFGCWNFPTMKRLVCHWVLTSPQEVPPAKAEPRYDYQSFLKTLPDSKLFEFENT